MIHYHHQTEFLLSNQGLYSNWLLAVIQKEGKVLGELNYIFLSDEALLQMNKEYLNHDYFTDIITFDYCEGDLITGDLFISVDRVADNAKKYHSEFLEELKRVMVHGILHLMGYGDKHEREQVIMRQKEDLYIKMFHVEH
jgi:rRNA maturation RNase YbeY